MVERVQEREVALYGMSGWRTSTADSGGGQLVRGFGNLDERAIAAGIAAIADLLR